jgi:hypothetical protein
MSDTDPTLTDPTLTDPTLAAALEYLAGKVYPGGCLDCNAEEGVVLEGSIYYLTISHSPTCPWLRERTR